MSDWQLWAATLVVPAVVAVAVVAVGRRCCPVGCWPLGLGGGYLGGFLAVRVVRSVLAGAGQPAGEWWEAARVQGGKLLVPTTVGDWLPWQALGLAAVVGLGSCCSGRWLRRGLWLLASVALVASIYWQFRKTRYFTFPTAETNGLLLQIAALLLMGWLALTWRWARGGSPAVGLLPEKATLVEINDGRGATRQAIWTGALAVAGGGILAVLLALSGSLTLGQEAFLIPAATGGALLGGLVIADRRLATAGLAALLVVWSGLGLLYVVHGALLAKLAIPLAWLWVAGAAVTVAGLGLRNRLRQPWRIVVGVLPLACWGLAVGLAARQFWLDTH